MSSAIEGRVTACPKCRKRYAYPLVPSLEYPSRVVFMNTNLMPGFQVAVDYWFDRVLQGMGEPIRDWIYDFLDKKGIGRKDIPTKFEEVVKTLTERLGNSARVIAYRTIVELYKEFALNPNFEYDDSLPDRFVYLRERVVTDRLRPTTPGIRYPV